MLKKKKSTMKKILLNSVHLELSSKLARQPAELHYRIPPPPDFPAPTQPPRQIRPHFFSHAGYISKAEAY